MKKLQKIRQKMLPLTVLLVSIGCGSINKNIAETVETPECRTTLTQSEIKGKIKATYQGNNFEVYCVNLCEMPLNFAERSSVPQKVAEDKLVKRLYEEGFEIDYSRIYTSSLDQNLDRNYACGASSVEGTLERKNKEENSK